MFRAKRQVEVNYAPCRTDEPQVVQTRLSTLEEDLECRLHAAEAQLEAIRAEVQHQQRLATIGTLSAGVLHEISNLLTPVLAYAQLAEARPNDSDLSRKVIAQCLTGVKSAADIASTLLGFASPHDDRNMRCNVRRTIEDALACVGRDLANDGVRCTVEVPEELFVCMPPLALQQVALNLMINATGALRQRTCPTIAIHALEFGGRIQIEIADNGPGIPDDVRDCLFEPFVSRETGGHGLGLWICKRLVEEAGGTINVESSPDSGTTFAISLRKA